MFALDIDCKKRELELLKYIDDLSATMFEHHQRLDLLERKVLTSRKLAQETRKWKKRRKDLEMWQKDPDAAHKYFQNRKKGDLKQ